jgi:hypothetical protein
LITESAACPSSEGRWTIQSACLSIFYSSSYTILFNVPTIILKEAVTKAVMTASKNNLTSDLPLTNLPFYPWELVLIPLFMSRLVVYLAVATEALPFFL